jgi:hypothetical protein
MAVFTKQPVARVYISRGLKPHASVRAPQEARDQVTMN